MPPPPAALRARILRNHELFRELSRRCPEFGDLITPAGLHRSLAANLNGDAFVSAGLEALPEKSSTCACAAIGTAASEAMNNPLKKFAV